MAQVDQVIVWEETLETPKSTSPKVKALQDRLMNSTLEKDATDVKRVVEERLAKASVRHDKVKNRIAIDSL